MWAGSMQLMGASQHMQASFEHSHSSAKAPTSKSRSAGGTVKHGVCMHRQARASGARALGADALWGLGGGAAQDSEGPVWRCH